MSRAKAAPGARGCIQPVHAAPVRESAEQPLIPYWIRALLLVLPLAACATPPEVKQAVSSIDQGYADNLQMMNQYRTLVVQTNERYDLWLRYVRSRGLLNLAAAWATTDPVAGKPPDDARDIATTASELLGPELVALINKIRLKDLPARGSQSSGFAASAGTMSGVIGALPALVDAVNRRVDKMMVQPGPVDLRGFDNYAANVAALRQINGTIKTYLAIDVTVKAEDVNEISQAIRDLRH